MEFDQQLAQVAHHVIDLIDVGSVVEEVGGLGVAVRSSENHRGLPEERPIHLVAEALGDGDVRVLTNRLDQVMLDLSTRVQDRHLLGWILAQDQRMALLVPPVWTIASKRNVSW